MATFKAGSGPVGLAYAAGKVWVADRGGSALLWLNPATGEVLGTLPLGQNRQPNLIGFDGLSLFVNFSDGPDMVQVDPGTGQFLSNVRVQFGSQDIISDGTYLWVASPNSSAITRMRLRDYIVDRTFTADSSNMNFNKPFSLAFDGTYLWVGDVNTGLITRYKPFYVDMQDTVATRGDPWSMLFLNGDMWITVQRRGVVVKVRASDRAPYGEFVSGAQPRGLASDGRSVWVANYGDGTVTRFNSEGGVMETIRVGRGPERVVFDGTYIWVSNSLDGTVSRIRP